MVGRICGEDVFEFRVEESRSDGLMDGESGDDGV